MEIYIMSDVTRRRIESFDRRNLSSAQGSKVGKRALILSMADGLMQRKRTCGYIIENVFADDVAALASWKSASHVENPPKKKKPPIPPTP